MLALKLSYFLIYAEGDSSSYTISGPESFLDRVGVFYSLSMP